MQIHPHSSPAIQHANPKTPRSWIKPHYACLNGLRGLAILMVFLNHYAGSFTRYTGQVLWTGVDLFFVLSGFLITGILFDTLESPHYFRDFYIRRTLRIFPIYYGFFLCLFLATPLLHLRWDWTLLSFPLYVGNLVTPLMNLNLHNPTQIWIVRHTGTFELGDLGRLWSLCVEEQFYLLWPAVVFWVRDRKKLMYICIITSFMVLLGRIYIYQFMHVRFRDYLLYFSTYTRCDSLLIGAWLALFLRGKQLSQVQLRRASAAIFWIPLVPLTLGIYHWRSHGIFTNPFTETVGYTLIALCAMGFLLRALDERGWIARILVFKPLAGLGVISYGFYIYHGIPSGAWEHVVAVHPQLQNAVPFLAFTITLAISWLSYRFYETPFLRLKKVLAPQRTPFRRPEDSVPLGFHVSEPHV